MRVLFSTLDRLLRGEFTSRDNLRRGKVTIAVRTLLVSGLVLGAIYGLFMGLYGVMRPANATSLQLVATAIKVPLLFLLTLAVTFPSLYVFSTLAGSRLEFVETLRLLLVGIVVNLALLASFGPVTGFFTLSTDSYPFMQVLNVVFFAIGGLAGLVFMYKALDAVMQAEPLSPEPERTDTESADAGRDEETASEAKNGKHRSADAAPRSDPPRVPYRPRGRGPAVHVSASDQGRARLIFATWTIIYGAVGAQMGWILRPFIGSPDLQFDWFRVRESNFFEAFFRALGQLFG